MKDVWEAEEENPRRMLTGKSPISIFMKIYRIMNLSAAFNANEKFTAN